VKLGITFMQVCQNWRNFASLPSIGYLLILLIEKKLPLKKYPEAILEQERGNVSMATLKFHRLNFKLWMKFHEQIRE
jgi:hypothetical protein